MTRLKLALFASALVPAMAVPSFAAGASGPGIAPAAIVVAQNDQECGPGTGVRCRNDRNSAEEQLKKRKKDGNNGKGEAQREKKPGREKRQPAPAAEQAPPAANPLAPPRADPEPAQRRRDQPDAQQELLRQEQQAEERRRKRQEQRAEEQRQQEQQAEEQRQQEQQAEERRRKRQEQRAEEQRQQEQQAEQPRRQRQDQQAEERTPRQERNAATDRTRRDRIERLREQRQDRRERLRDRRDAQREEQRRETLKDIRQARRQRTENGNVIIDEGDGRTIITRRNGDVIIRNDESDRIRSNARDVEVRRLPNGFEETTVYRPDGTQVVTLRDARGRLLQRSRVLSNGRRYVLYENDPGYYDNPDRFRVLLPPPIINIPRDRYIVEANNAPPELIYDTFAAPLIQPVPQRYALDQVVNSPDLLERVRRVDIDSINFETGSWKVDENQIDELDKIAEVILDLIQQNPDEVFLIEGHTDAVGSDLDNLTLSDRRAEEVAYLLTEYYDVPAENLTTKGYGEQNLKVPTEGPSRENRRVTMRRITPLLETAGG